MLINQVMDTFTRNRVRDRSYSKLPTNYDVKRTKRMKFRRKSVLKFAIFFALITLYYFDFVSGRSGIDFLNSILYRVNYHDVRHVIVIDAGSTGSRVIAFSFYKQLITKEIQLIDEHRMITKPGLSSYADNAENASASITKLLDQVITHIPKSQWSQTPLIFRATAGLRLLDESVANKLLGTIRNRLLGYPFIANKESVEIMKGDDEGIFSWLTVNYLLGTLHTAPENTVAALDLGGGSTQVTLTVTLPEVIQKSPYLYRIKQFANSQVYTRSYLGLGLKAARHEILTQRNESSVVSSVCVNKKYKNIPWTYANHDHFVNGLLADLAGFEKCDDFVRDFVMAQVEEIEELPKRKIVAFSYYFDKAFDYKITKSEVGETVVVKQFKTAAKKICLQSDDSDNAFGCVDLVFISNLLHYGFQLNEDTEIHLKKKIHGHEISWALGLAIDSVEGLF